MLDKLYNFVFYKKNIDESLSKKYFMSKELAKFCNKNHKIPVIRFHILKQIYDFLKSEFDYTYIYYGESHELNLLINFNPNVDEQMYHSELFKRLLLHFY